MRTSFLFQPKTLILALAVAAASLSVQAQTQAAAPAKAPQTPVERMSYSSGVAAVRNFTKGEVPFDIEMMIQGMRDALAGQSLALSEKDVRVALNSLQADLRRAQVRDHRAATERNTKRGAEFMEAYKLRPGVQMLPNGVAYSVLKAGSGAKPLESDSVLVKYRGMLVDGTEFDATEADKPATLRVQQVIMGWREALKAMPVGSTWQIVVPYALAYGERGAGNGIGPNETLVFEIELLATKAAQ